MAQPREQREQPFRPEDSFLSEAELTSPETRTGPTIIEVSPDDGSESAFYPEDPLAPPVESSRRKSVFAYDPEVLRNPPPPMPIEWRPQYEPPPSSAWPGTMFVDAAVVFAIFVAIGVFGARAMLWQSEPASRSQETREESPAPTATTPAEPVAPAPAAVTTSVKPPSTKSADNGATSSRSPAPAAKSTPPTTSPAASATPRQTAAPPPPVVSQKSIVPASPPGRGRSNAPAAGERPATSERPPAVARAESQKAPAASPGVQLPSLASPSPAPNTSSSASAPPPPPPPLSASAPPSSPATSPVGAAARLSEPPPATAPALPPASAPVSPPTSASLPPATSARPPASPSAPTPVPFPSSAPRVTPALAPAPAPRAADTAAVEAVLTRYRSAYAALDAGAVADIWPTARRNALANAFAQLQEQDFVFNDCRIDLNGRIATAACSGTARFVPKVGSRTPRVESRQWTFHLYRAGEAWALERVESR